MRRAQEVRGTASKAAQAVIGFAVAVTMLPVGSGTCLSHMVITSI